MSDEIPPGYEIAASKMRAEIERLRAALAICRSFATRGLAGRNEDGVHSPGAADGALRGIHEQCGAALGEGDE